MPEAPALKKCGSPVKGHPQLHTELEASLGYIRPRVLPSFMSYWHGIILEEKTLIEKMAELDWSLGKSLRHLLD